MYALLYLCRFFFFKQKTAYEIMSSLVGSEMCIRDREVPLGLDARICGLERVRLRPELPFHARNPGAERKRDREEREDVQADHPKEQVPHREVREEGHAAVPRLRLGRWPMFERLGHPLPLDEEQVCADEARHDQRKDANVEREKPVQRLDRYLFAAPEHAQHPWAHDGDGLYGVGPDGRREIAQLVPGQEVARESEAQNEAEHRKAGEPRQLARLAIGLREQDAEEVRQNGEAHEVRRPAMDRADEPSERHAAHEVLHALV